MSTHLVRKTSRPPWTVFAGEGDVHALEVEVARLREELRRPVVPGDGAAKLEEERQRLTAQVHALDDQRVRLAARRDELRGHFEEAVRRGRRRDARLFALGHLLGLGVLVAAGVGLVDLDASLLVRGGTGPQGVALLVLVGLGLALRTRRQG